MESCRGNIAKEKQLYFSFLYTSFGYPMIAANGGRDSGQLLRSTASCGGLIPCQRKMDWSIELLTSPSRL
jgi:hypothetical protein